LPPRLGRTTHQQAAADIAVHRAGQRNQPGHAVGIEPAAFDEWRIPALAGEVTATHQPRQVQVPGFALAEQREPGGRLTLDALGQPQVDTNHRFESLRDRRAEELHHREQVGLVGQRDGRHARGGNRIHQLRHPHDAVDEGVLGMKSQVNKRL